MYFAARRGSLHPGDGNRASRLAKDALLARQSCLPNPDSFVMHYVPLAAGTTAGLDHLIPIEHAPDLQAADRRCRLDRCGPGPARAQRGCDGVVTRRLHTMHTGLRSACFDTARHRQCQPAAAGGAEYIERVFAQRSGDFMDHSTHGRTL